MSKINDNINISGSIGYTVLTNNKDKDILILADNHSQLPYCKNGKFVSDWMKSKNNSKILLEEVPRIGNNLKELWPDAPHTQKLKNLFLENSIEIDGVDVRPFLIPFSWELVEQVNDIKLKEYLNLLDKFFMLEHPYFINKLNKVYKREYLNNSKLGNHFLNMKNQVKNYVKQNKTNLNESVKKLDKKNKLMFEQINIFISDVMEFYIIAKVFNENNNKFIVHAGLFHTNNLNKLLLNNYSFELKRVEGINSINNIDDTENSCLTISSDVNNYF